MKAAVAELRFGISFSAFPPFLLLERSYVLSQSNGSEIQTSLTGLLRTL